MICPFAKGARPWGGGKSCIYFVYIRLILMDIKCIIDAYIRCPYAHAYIRCLAAAAAGNSDDCTIVVGFLATEQQRCWQRCCT